MTGQTVAQGDNVLFRVKGDETLYRGLVLDVKNLSIKISGINETVEFPIDSLAKKASRIFKGTYWVVPRNKMGMPAMKIIQYPRLGKIETNKPRK